MTTLLPLFLENIFPIISVASVGFLIQRAFKINPRPLSIVIFYALTPSLVFQLTIDNTTNSLDSFRMISLVILLVMVLCLVSYGFARLLKLSSRMTAAVILTTAFMNAGNYGLSLNKFALGDLGLVWASLFYITHVVLNNSLGVFVASAGKSSFRKSLTGLIKVPALWTFLLALGFRSFHAEVPSPIMKPIELMAAATIPAMLLVLGMQIGRSGVPERIGLVSLATSIRLILSPLIAWLLTALLKMPTLGSQTSILEAGMPSPVLAIIISLEYDTEPDFVGSVVLLSTLLSPITLTIIMGLLSL